VGTYSHSIGPENGQDWRRSKRIRVSSELHEDTGLRRGYIAAGVIFMIFVRAIAILVLLLPAVAAQEKPAANSEPSAKTWVGRYQEMEEYLRTAECVDTLQKPAGGGARCTLPAGGPIARFAWKPFTGVNRGFRESYRNEIAAYELDKLLKLDMVPPTVERQMLGTKGAAQQWLEGVVDLKTGGTSPDESHRSHWENQLVKVRMFDNLIANRGRNPGNFLRDKAWNVFLVDYARAFGTENELLHEMTRIDGEFWTRIEGLTRKQLDDGLGAWLDQDQIRAILDRRDTMRAKIKLQSKQN
jgi:hypothetical protein